MPKRMVAVGLMALSVVSLHHKPADAAPRPPSGAVASTKNMAEPVHDCRACYGTRVAGRQGRDEGYRYRPKVQGWARRATLYWPRPRPPASARWDPGFRYGAASWGDQRAWTYYGRW